MEAYKHHVGDGGTSLLELVVLSASGADESPSFSSGQIVLIVAPATIALLGVIITAIVTSWNIGRSEDRRTKNAVSAEILDRGRVATLGALYAVGSAVADFKAFNGAMSGNSGLGEDDERSAAAIRKFIGSFEGLDGLTKASIDLQVLGSLTIAEKVQDIRRALLEYLMSLTPPVFKGADASRAEDEIDLLVKDLIESVRDEFGTEAARFVRPGAGKRVPQRE